MWESPKKWGAKMANIKLEMQSLSGDGSPIDSGETLNCLIDPEHVIAAAEIAFADDDMRLHHRCVRIVYDNGDQYLVKDERRLVLSRLMEHMPDAVKCDRGPL